MANSNVPFKRLGIGQNSWEDLLKKVNDELENPPENTDCEPIDPIEVPGPMHRWAKSDIREVHDKLNEMPNDCFTFEPIPDLWKVSIIEDIENQLSNSWCDCEEDEICCEPCTNAGEESTTFITSITSEACTTPCQDGCKEVTPGNFNCQSNLCTPLINQQTTLAFTWANAACAYCVLFKEAEELQEELDALEEELDALEEAFNNCPGGPSGDACRAALQPQIDAKQDEIDAKQAELDAKIAERDAKLTERNTAFTDLDAKRLEVINCITSCCEDSEQGGTACISLLPLTGPPIAANEDCSDFSTTNAECCGCKFFQCTVDIKLQRRVITLHKPSDITTTGTFVTRARGTYDKAGKLSITSASGNTCCCLLANGCCCTKFTAGVSGPCSASICNSTSCTNETTHEWQSITEPPTTFDPFDCVDGTPCDGIPGVP